MKKIYLIGSLLLALGSSLTTSAVTTKTVYAPSKRATSIVSGTKYFIFDCCYVTTSNQNRTNFLNGGANPLGNSGNAEPSTFTTADDGYLFTVDNVSGSTYSFKGKLGYVGIGGATNNASVGASQTFTVETYSTSAKKSGTDAGCIPDLIAGETAGTYTNYTNVWAIYIGNTTFNGDKGSWATWSTAHPYAFYEVKEVGTINVYSVTVNYKDKAGTVLGTSTFDVQDGNTFTLPTTYKTKAVLSASVDGKDVGSITGAITPTADATYDVVCSDSPLMASPAIADDATAFPSNTIWYYMQFGKSDKYMSYPDGGASITLSAALPATITDNYKWCFTGNATDGYKIYNKAAGTGKYLSSATPTSSNDGTTYPLVQATTTGNNTTWDLSAGNSNGYFYIAQHGTTNRMNERDSKLAYWVDGADQGSDFKLTCASTVYNVTLTAKGAITDGNDVYQSYKSPSYLYLPSDLSAEYVSAVSETNVTTSPLTADGLTRGDAVLLKGKAGSTYSLVEADGAFTGTSGNKLKASATDMTVTDAENIWVLAYEKTSTDAKFYKFSGTLPAGKVYLTDVPVTTTGAVKALTINGGLTTGINAATTTTQTANTCVDLQGRKVVAPTKGLYIMNGKKVILK